MRHYEGKVGIFDYDETQFFEDLDGCFRYCGKEIDGSKINIPYGIINCCSMFIYKPITKMPSIPNSVLKTDYMFAYCAKLSVLTDFPDSIESAAYMFQQCNSIVNADIHLSTSLKNAEGLFNSCKSLKTPPTLLPNTLTKF